jgi:hypothetical protein
MYSSSRSSGRFKPCEYQHNTSIADWSGNSGMALALGCLSIYCQG